METVTGAGTGSGLTTKPHNAFVGPRPLDGEYRVYGRDRELVALTCRLLSERLVLMYSPSGAGKSSVIMAANGVRERMTEEGFVRTPVVRVSLAAEVAARARVNRYLLSTLVALEEARPEADRRGPEALAGLLPKAGTRPPAGFLDAHLAGVVPHGDRPGQPFLVFDQFEEFLTLDPTDGPAKEVFLRQVGHALLNNDRWALFAMREDHVAGLDPYLPYLPTRLAATFRLDFLGRAAAREAVQKPPAEDRFRVTVEDAAVNRLIDELARVNVQDPVTGLSESKSGPYVEPVYLQVVCQRLWLKRKEADKITLADLDQYHGVTAALVDYYDEAVRRVADDRTGGRPAGDRRPEALAQPPGDPHADLGEAVPVHVKDAQPEGRLVQFPDGFLDPGPAVQPHHRPAVALRGHHDIREGVVQTPERGDLVDAGRVHPAGEEARLLRPRSGRRTP